jgi:hypothetical protein
MMPQSDEELEAEIASTVEALFNVEPDHTGTLLALFARCTVSQAAKILRCLPDPPPGAARQNGGARPTERGPTWVWTH